jgi:hypothetical protein
MTIPEDAEFLILPTTVKGARDVWTITGASGGGKSYIAKQIAEEYKRMWPDRKVYCLSALGKDSTLDGMRDDRDKRFLKRLDISSFVEEPLEDGDELSGFKNALVIFDDCEALHGPQKKEVDKILKSLLTLGRHSGTSVIVCNHQPARGKETALLLSESTMFVVFPAAMGYHSLLYLCEHHIGLSKAECAEIRRVPSRWVALARSFPRYLLSSNEARVL